MEKDQLVTNSDWAPASVPGTGRLAWIGQKQPWPPCPVGKINIENFLQTGNDWCQWCQWRLWGVNEIWRMNENSVQFSCVWLFETPWTAAHQASLSITNSWSLLKLMSIESVMPSNHLILCHTLLLPPSMFPCIRFFSNESVLRISLATEERDKRCSG